MEPTWQTAAGRSAPCLAGFSYGPSGGHPFVAVLEEHLADLQAMHAIRALSTVGLGLRPLQA